MSSIFQANQPVAQRLTTNFYASATGATGPSQLSFPIQGANVSFSANLNVVGGTGGVKLGASVPSGAVFYASIEGVSTGVNDQMMNQSTPTLTVLPFCVGVTGPVLLNGLVLAPAGVTGVVQFLMGPMAATGPTGTIGTGSSLITWLST